MTDLSPVKDELRKKIKQGLAALSPEAFRAAGQKAADLLCASPLWRKYDDILIFRSMKDEIDTDPIIRAATRENRKLYTPSVSGETMTFYRQMSRETPVDPLCALIICPGLAFDRGGGRLGRGRGFYDRFLAAAGQHGAFFLGLCMNCQLVEEVPACSHDVRMDAVLTESGIFP